MLSISWELLIGLGIFLYGMSRLETAIGALSGARLKAALARSTAGPIRSAGFGALITSVLQSSSMVSLLVLAFASAGIVPLYNAIGVLVGANLGTTLTGWIVATLGFKLDLARLALPLLGIGGLVQVLCQSEQKRRLYAWGKTATGLGLLLFGLTLMKESVGDLSERLDISLLQGHHPVYYLLAGLVVTALIQSSSATVMITLAALHGGLIDLSEAGALVIGADLGTTGTTLLASMTGPGIKRQLALAQLIFNVVVDMLAFVFLLPLLPWGVMKLGISDPLFSLVAFHSMFNLLGLIIFLPILKPFSRWIERTFKITHDPLVLLEEITSPAPEATLPALEQTLQKLWLVAADNSLRLMDIDSQNLKINEQLQQALTDACAHIDENGSHRQIYEHIKMQEAAIFRIAYKLQQGQLNSKQSKQLGQLQELARSIVYASKTMQDIAGDIQQLKNSRQETTSTANWLLTQQQQFLQQTYSSMLPLMQSLHQIDYLQERLELLDKSNDLHYKQMNQGVYQRASHDTDGEPILSMQLNVNREILHATHNLIQSIWIWQEILSPSSDVTTDLSPSRLSK
jgi:phosphate:Na+ symporter